MNNQSDFFGTVFQIEKQSYVRLEGFAGVLFPLYLSDANHDFINGAAARIVGRLERDHRGFPTLLHATSVEVIGVKNVD